MEEVGMIGLDLAKTVFQAHGAGADGSVVFRHGLLPAQLLQFMAAQLPCVVAMEAPARAHLRRGRRRLINDPRSRMP